MESLEIDMAEGTIEKFIPERGFGFIRPDRNGKTVFFHINAVHALSETDLNPGARVRYESEPGLKGPRASVVMPAAATGVSQPSTGGGQRDYRFLNPYNFVTPIQAGDPHQAPLLGRCPPPPHDRYSGLTGRIVCQLEATTPLFISDSEGVQEDERKGHYRYRFFRYDGEPAIPATSLRGPIRSVFEAATGSCFSVFRGDRRLSYHLPPRQALQLVPGRVVRTDAGWQLELLSGTMTPAPGHKPSGPQYAAWVRAYDPMRRSRNLNGGNSPYSRRKKIDLQGWEHGDACRAVIELVHHPSGRFSFWNATQLVKPDDPAPSPAAGQRVVDGYLCVTNQNIENKHDERLFFSQGPPPTVPLSDEARRSYEELIADYQERHEKEVGERRRRGKDPSKPVGRDKSGFSWFVYRRTDRAEQILQPGDLVYAMLGQSRAGYNVDFLVPVSVPRVGYDRLVGDLLDSHSHECTSYDALCPACRVFGWVREGQEEQGDPLDSVAYAGRVRFSHAGLLSSAGTFDATLAILSSPKPTTTRFYLRPAAEDRAPRDGCDDSQIDYSCEANQRLRGRKFYRHVGERLNEREYARSEGQRDDQNRTALGIEKAGGRFEFSVRFENLAPLELGALLWTLEVDGWHHRIGFGKPLGFGSVRIRVQDLSLIDLDRWRGLNSEERSALERKEALIDAFKDGMEARFGKPFDELANIDDLRALLAESPQLPVHYPRTTSAPTAEGRNFEWFMGNNRGPRLVLPLPSDEGEGLPLLQRNR